MKNKGENVSIRDTIRLIDYYDNNIPHIQIENTRYISENAITSFMETSGIQSEGIIIRKLKEDNHTNMYVVTEDSDIGLFMAILEALNVTDINDINHLDQISGFIFDKIYTLIGRKKFNNIQQLDERIKKCQDLLDSIDEEIARIDRIKNGGDKKEEKLSNAKFISMYIRKLISGVVFDIGKPLAVAEKITPFGMVTSGTKLAYNFSSLTLSIVNYRVFLKANYAKIDSVKKSLEAIKKKYETKEAAKTDKEKNNNESKK